MMHIPKLLVSTAKHEACKSMKLKYDNNNEAVLPKTDLINNHHKANGYTIHRLSSNAHTDTNPSKELGAATTRKYMTTRQLLDMKLSKTQLNREQLKKIFQYHDRDNDGFLNRLELTKAFGFLGSISPFYKACYAMMYADANGDGLISEDELDKVIEYANKIIKKK